jgi:hypothetical protein
VHKRSERHCDGQCCGAVQIAVHEEEENSGLGGLEVHDSEVHVASNHGGARATDAKQPGAPLMLCCQGAKCSLGAVLDLSQDPPDCASGEASRIHFCAAGDESGSMKQLPDDAAHERALNAMTHVLQDSAQLSVVHGPAGDESTSAQQLPSDAAYERALKAMMHGDPGARGAAAEVWRLEKPDWMLEGEAAWTAEQKRLAGEWAAEQKRLDEERERRRAALDGEVRFRFELFVSTFCSACGLANTWARLKPHVANVCTLCNALASALL